MTWSESQITLHRRLSTRTPDLCWEALVAGWQRVPGSAASGTQILLQPVAPSSSGMALLLLLLLASSLSVSSAKSVPQGSPPPPLAPDCAPCTLPFLYEGRLHFECTTSSPVQGDLFGRCPRAAGPGGEASMEPKDWVRCDLSCPLQQYTSNAGLVRHLEALAEQFPLTARVVEVRAGEG